MLEGSGENWKFPRGPGPREKILAEGILGGSDSDSLQAEIRE